MEITKLLWVMAGGGIGSGLRYAVSVLLLPGVYTHPYPTLFVNLLGSLILGFFMCWQLPQEHALFGVRLLLTTGMMGGFTTYSTFNYELLTFLQNGAWTRALSYAAMTLLACLLGGSLGILLGKSLLA